MDFRTIWGIPAHPLFVHIPVVLLPLVGIGAVAMAVSHRVRERFGWLVLGLAIIAGISTQLAIGSGQALEDSVDRSAALRHHISIAESLRPLALLLFLFALALMLFDRRAAGAWPFRQAGARRAVSPVVMGALSVLTIVAAIGANVRLFQIGDSGATATWQRVHLQSGGERAKGGGGDDR